MRCLLNRFAKSSQRGGRGKTMPRTRHGSLALPVTLPVTLPVALPVALPLRDALVCACELGNRISAASGIDCFFHDQKCKASIMKSHKTAQQSATSFRHVDAAGLLDRFKSSWRTLAKGRQSPAANDLLTTHGRHVFARSLFKEGQCTR